MRFKYWLDVPYSFYFIPTFPRSPCRGRWRSSSARPSVRPCCGLKSLPAVSEAGPQHLPHTQPEPGGWSRRADELFTAKAPGAKRPPPRPVTPEPGAARRFFVVLARVARASASSFWTCFRSAWMLDGPERLSLSDCCDDWDKEDGRGLNEDANWLHRKRVF